MSDRYQIIKCKSNDESQICKRTQMISKAREDFNKDKRVINIRNDFFQKICCLLTIKTENDYNLKSRSFKFLKLSTLIFFFINQIH